MKILLGTTNPGKFRELSSILETYSFEIEDLRNFSNITEVEETGSTLEENAILKAKGYFNQTGIPCITDDGGLYVDALGGLPGVQSRRWLGYGASDKELAEGVIERLKGVPYEQRTARFSDVSAFWDGKNLFIAKNSIEGHISEHLLHDPLPGFPYRVIVIVDRFNKFFSELTEEELKQESIRHRNLSELKEKIPALYHTAQKS